MIDFEKDQQDSLRRTDNIQSLADQVEKLEKYIEQLKAQEDIVKKTKEEIDRLSGEVIPTMMSEMGLSELKLQDGSHLQVATSYKASITEANKEMAFNWLRENGLGDIIKMKLMYHLVVTKITRQQSMLNLRGVKGFNQHKR
jgi:TolA-binding protein